MIKRCIEAPKESIELNYLVKIKVWETEVLIKIKYPNKAMARWLKRVDENDWIPQLTCLPNSKWWLGIIIKLYIRTN